MADVLLIFVSVMAFFFLMHCRSLQPKAELTTAGGPHVGHVASSGPGGLLGFLQGYPNPLTRFTGGASATTSKAGGVPDGTEAGIDPGSTAEEPITGAPEGGAGAVQMGPAQQRGGGSYPLATLVFVALIAFLVGSLLRSLLSPADFIYVVTDLREAEEGVGGWREIRRLVEIKYLWGGWDLQVAVVRRQ